jgi:hypothetical protein
MEPGASRGTFAPAGPPVVGLRRARVRNRPVPVRTRAAPWGRQSCAPALSDRDPRPRVPCEAGWRRVLHALRDEAPPATAEKQMRDAVSRLRASLAPEPGKSGDITAVGDAGYRMMVPRGALHTGVFACEVAAAGRPRPPVPGAGR